MQKLFHYFYLCTLLINNYHDQKINLTITLDGKKFWNYEGTTKHAEKRLVIAEVMKQVIRKVFKADEKASYRESKELIPIENRIRKIKKENKPDDE